MSTSAQLSREDCFALLLTHGTPDHVIRHCTAVCETALKLGYALNQKGYQMDLVLLQAAALLHDIARVEERHWDVGARIARELGQSQVADLIQQHMTHTVDALQYQIRELDLLCLADRMTREDEHVGLRARMNSILERYQGQPEIEARIRGHLEENRQIKHFIEEILGETVEELLAKPLPVIL